MMSDANLYSVNSDSSVTYVECDKILKLTSTNYDF